MIHARIWIAVVALTGTVTAFADAKAGHEVVLIAAADAPVSPHMPNDVRRLYLGVPVTEDNHRIRAVHNRSDPLLYQVFLQKVIFMSADNYERRVLSQIFRGGGQRPEEYNDIDALIKALQSNPYSISYMWAEEAARHSKIKVVQPLWQGPSDSKR